MAVGVIGGPAGYATVEGPQRNYIGDAMSNAENLAFKYREEKRQEDERKAAIKKANEVKDDFKGDMSVTGNTTLNDLTLPYAMEAKRKYAENAYKINNTNDPAERQRLMQANNKIEQSFSVTAQIPDQLNKIQADLIQGVKDKKYSERDAARVATMLDSIQSGKGRAYIDEYGQPRIDVYKVDAAGKPTGEIATNQTISELMKSLNPHLASTYDEDLGKETKDYKINEIVREKGGQKLTTQLKGQRELENADAFANRVLNEPHNVFEISQRTGIPEIDIEGLKSHVEKEYLSRLREVDKQERDSSYESLQETKRQHRIENARAARKEAKEDSVIIGETPTILKDKIVEGVRLSDGTKSYPIEGALIGKEGKGTQATNIFVSPKGKMFLRIEDIGFEGDSKKTSGLSEQGKRNIEAYKKANPNDKKLENYQIQIGDQVDVTTTDRAPKGRLLDFGKDGSEISRYAQKMNTTVRELQEKYLPAKTESAYTSTQEKAIKTALKNNPGYTRAEIISALKLK